MSYSSEVLADTPIGYWRLDETSGTNAADSSGNSHAGTYTNAPTLNQTGLLVADANTAVSFDGSNDYVNLSNPSALRLTSAFTLEAWVKVATGETLFGNVIGGEYDGARVNYILGSFDGSNHSLKPSVGFYNGSWHVAQSASAISVNAVHHLVGTWDGTTLKMFVDGSQVQTNVPGSSPTTGTSNYFIGSRWDNAGDGQKFKGILDEIAIYGTDIGSTRVSAHYTAGTTNPNGTALPSVVAGNGQIPNPTGIGAGNTSPATAVGTGAVPAAVASGQGTGAPSTTVGTGLVPAPSASGASLASPATVAGVGSVPVATAIGGGSSIGNPATVVGVGTVPAATVFATAVALPATVAGIGAVPAPVAQGIAFTSPTTVSGTGVVPGATAGAIQNATGLPDNVIGIGRVRRAVAVGEGTGGGGGSDNGANDFWLINALG